MKVPITRSFQFLSRSDVYAGIKICQEGRELFEIFQKENAWERHRVHIA